MEKEVFLKIIWRLEEKFEDMEICYIKRDVPYEKAKPQREKKEKEVSLVFVTAWCRSTF